MKKLLVLALVLGVASMASAAIVLQASNTLVSPGEVVTMTVVTTAGENVKGMTIGLISEGGAGGTATPGSVNVKFVNGADAGYDGATLGLGGTAGDIGYVNGAVDLPNWATGTLYTYSYQVSAAAAPGSMINFTFPDTSGDPYYFPTAITTDQDAVLGIEGTSLEVIPEPITIGLLALGGLFIRRRK
jgi:hypothetical protein